jgi:hypothetical protein
VGNKVIDYLKILHNQPLYDIGRHGNVTCINIGEPVEVDEYFMGEYAEKSAIVLLLECAWRIVDTENKQILLASDDVYEPKTDMVWTETFNWDTPDGNLFDEKSKLWFQENKPLYIADFNIGRFGDLYLTFSNGHKLSTLTDTSNKLECWRVFECNSKNDHLVLFGTGFIFEYFE